MFIINLPFIKRSITLSYIHFTKSKEPLKFVLHNCCCNIHKQFLNSETKIARCEKSEILFWNLIFWIYFSSLCYVYASKNIVAIKSDRRIFRKKCFYQVWNKVASDSVVVQFTFASIGLLPKCWVIPIL